MKWLKPDGFSVQKVRNGETSFDDFTGSMNIANKAYRFNDLYITSGLLDGSEDLNVTANRTVFGHVSVTLCGSAGVINAPLEIADTQEDEMLPVSRGTIAGGAVGTAMLGPGLGTSIGAVAGAMFGKLLKHGTPEKKKEASK